MNKRGALALSQALILVIGIVAISYAVGGGIGIVKGADLAGKPKKNYEPREGEVSFDHANAKYYLQDNDNLIKVVNGQKDGIVKYDSIETQDFKLKVESAIAIRDNAKTANKNEKNILSEDLTKQLYTTGKKDDISSSTLPDYSKIKAQTRTQDLQNKIKFREEAAGIAKEYQEQNPDQQTPDEMKSLLGMGFMEYKKDGFLDMTISSLAWAGMVSMAVKFIGPMLGYKKEFTDALSTALFGGILAGQLTTKIAAKGFKGKHANIKSGTIGGIVGAGVGIALFMFSYMKKERGTFTFTCQPWDAPTGGNKCEECNKGLLPCSEYQCRSLGQACELLNPGTDDEKCAWVNRQDVNPPIIEPSESYLLEGYQYGTQTTGVTVEYREATAPYCARAFTPISFGLTLNEPGKCKIDLLRKDNFEDMSFFLSSGLLLYNHSYAMTLPSPSALESENITIENDGEYELYVRCQDANGNYNKANFVFKFCVSTGPDTTPPLIVTTDPLSGRPIGNEQTEVENVNVYVNEPAQCRWSHEDRSYDSMGEEMSCPMSLSNINAQGLYPCTTTLTGLKDNTENKFYFRCKDTADNLNEESYEYSLIGTEPLVIDWVKPEEGSMIKDSTEAIKVTLEAKTSAGFDEGRSLCYYSATGDTEDYVMFFDDGEIDKYQHAQDLWLPEGDYNYFIKCIDFGGNSDVKETNFSVESDLNAPLVIRASHRETFLKLRTNEPARCVYDIKYETLPCDYAFDDGTPMSTESAENLVHLTDWDTKKTYYVRCQDEFGKQPAYGDCSIIVKPSKLD
jgi:hypothetical protein